MAVKTEKYKQTELGLIPEDWTVDYIGNLATIKTGSRNTQDKVQNGIYPFFVRSQTVERINSYSFDGEAVLTAGDGVGVGKVIHYVNEKFDCHQRVYRITDFKSTLNGYFFYLYFSNNFLQRIMQMTAKSSVDSVRMEMIAAMPIALPSTIEEQFEIAEALSDADALINGLEKLVAKKRMIKQGAIQELLKPKKGWVERRLGEILKIRHGKNQKEVASKNGDYPILASGGEIGHATSFLYNKPSVLIGRKGTIDKPQYMSTPFWCVDTLFYTEVFDGYDAKYIFYLFNTINWYLYNEASGVPSLNAKTIEMIETWFPNYDTQIEIAAILSDMDAEITTLETKLEKYKQIKLGMMQNLLTGKIRLI